MKNPKPIVLYVLLLISMALWGTSYVWGKIALESYSAFTVIFFRLLVSVIVILPVLFLTKRFKFPSKNNLYLFIILAFFEPFLYFIGETNGLKYVDASMTSAIIAVIPLFTPFVAYYFLKEKIRAVNILGILISILGIIFLVFDKHMNLQVPLKGLLLLSLAVIAANGYSVIIKKMPLDHSVLNILFWQNLFGLIMFLPIVAIFDIQAIKATGFVYDSAIAIVNLGVFASTIAFLFFIYALRFMPITKANVFSNTIPIFTLIIAWLVMDEPLSIRKIIGVFIVIAGVVVSQLRYKSS